LSGTWPEIIRIIFSEGDNVVKGDVLATHFTPDLVEVADADVKRLTHEVDHPGP
jgi:hypothetical protein